MISFLVVGHTKFAPDWCFGLLKRLYEVVKNSADCNYSQMCLLRMEVQLFLRKIGLIFRHQIEKIIGIKKYHHFLFDSTSPGVVHIKERCDTSEHSLDLLKASWAPKPTDLPTVIHPKSFSAERQWYLYNQIWPFCPDMDNDVTCPLSSVPLPSSRSWTLVLPSLMDAGAGQRTAEDGVDETGLSAPWKQRRVCSLCK